MYSPLVFTALMSTLILDIGHSIGLYSECLVAHQYWTLGIQIGLCSECLELFYSHISRKFEKYRHYFM